jgi:hypothetical protein
MAGEKTPSVRLRDGLFTGRAKSEAASGPRRLAGVLPNGNSCPRATAPSADNAWKLWFDYDHQIMTSEMLSAVKENLLETFPPCCRAQGRVKLR